MQSSSRGCLGCSRWSLLALLPLHFLSDEETRKGGINLYIRFKHEPFHLVLNWSHRTPLLGATSFCTLPNTSPSKHISIEMRVKSEKIAEICTFFFETHPKWQPYIAKQMFFLYKVSRVRRQSLAHAYAHAFQQRCCFFAVTSVTLRVKNRGKMGGYWTPIGGKIHIFRWPYRWFFKGHTPRFVKIHLTNRVISCIIAD